MFFKIEFFGGFGGAEQREAVADREAFEEIMGRYKDQGVTELSLVFEKPVTDDLDGDPTEPFVAPAATQFPGEPEGLAGRIKARVRQRVATGRANADEEAATSNSNSNSKHHRKGQQRSRSPPPPSSPSQQGAAAAAGLGRPHSNENPNQVGINSIPTSEPLGSHITPFMTLVARAC